MTLIDNEALQEQLEAEQETDEVSVLEATLMASLLVGMTELFAQYGTDEGLNLNAKRKKNFFLKVTQIITGHYSNVSNMIEGHAKAAYEQAYEAFMTAYEEELELPLVQILSEELIQAAFENGFPLKKTMQHNQTTTLRRLRRDIQDITRRSEDLSQATVRLQETVRNDANRVRVVVQEETARVQNEAQIQSVNDAEEQGVGIQVIWNSLRDGKVRKAHRELHGQKADAEGWFYVDGDKAKHPHGFSKIGLNIRCRCYLEIRGVNVADSEIARELNSADSSSARREVWEMRRALARERARGDIS